MAEHISILEQLDATVAAVLADWNVYTTLLAGILVAFVTYSVISSKDPDIHPFLLARQSTASPKLQRQSANHINLRRLKMSSGALCSFESCIGVSRTIPRISRPP